jgi:hypothetical protein
LIRSRSLILLITVLAAASPSNASSIPGKYYEYYEVASTSLGTFTALGNQPAINDYGLVAFTGTTSIGQTIWIGDGDNNPALDINPGFGNPTPGREDFSTALQINNKKQVASQDTTNATSIASQARLWIGTGTDSFKYIARGGSGQKFNGVLAYPSVNNNGDSVVVVFNGVQKYLYELEASGTTAQEPISGDAPQPVIADDGEVVVTQNDANGNAQLYLYSAPGLTLGTPIAGSNYFSSIDTAPGISSNGLVIAFQGNLNAAGATALGTNAGPGIFIAFNAGSTWLLNRVTGFQTCTPTCFASPELGYNDANAPISFSSYATGSRVTVMDEDLGATGLLDDTLEIAFVATPTSASRTNPWVPNFPLLFSAQQGLWTVRVDIEASLAVLNPPASPHVIGAIPVAQIGDQIGAGNIVSQIGFNMQLGAAAKDETGAVRTQRRGDHRVAFWVQTNSGAQIVFRANHLDSDQDGLLDHWETTGIDMDQDGTVDLDLPAMGANPNKRDLFVELDWLAPQTNMSFQPSPGVIGPLPESGLTMGSLPLMFNAAPALTGTLYGVRSDGAAPQGIAAGIVLHVDAGRDSDTAGVPLSVNMGSGPLDGGKLVGMPANPTALVHVLYFGADGSVTISGANARSFANVKQTMFSSGDKDARELAFRFGVLAFSQSFIDSPPAVHGLMAATINSITPADAIPGAVAQHTVIYILSGPGAGEINFVADVNGGAINLDLDWPVIPTTSSQFVYLQGSTGLAELAIAHDPDDNSLAGNDFELDAVGVFGYTNPEMPCYQWRTMAHEMGHTLGLRHDGINSTPNDNANYLSLMSYAYQLECDTTVNSYGSLPATATAPGFSDWASLEQDFTNSQFFLAATSIGVPTYALGDTPDQSETQTIQDYIAANGLIDTTPPVVSITSPVANAVVGLGDTLTVTVHATDNVSVASVRVTFDVNGTGVPVGVSAKSAGSGVYHAQFTNVAGAVGTRAITALAVDPTGNFAKTSVNVQVVNPNPPPALASLQPPSVTHGAATFYLIINGTGFVNGVTGLFKGAARKTVFVSATQIKMAVLNTDVATAGTASITAVNPAQTNGTSSNALTLTIN